LNDLIEFLKWFHKREIERQNETVETIKADNCCQFLLKKHSVLISSASTSIRSIIMTYTVANSMTEYNMTHISS